MNTKLLDRFVKPSTRQFIREARQARDYSIFDFLHGYVYARWPYLYIGIGTGGHPLSKIYRRFTKLIGSQNGRKTHVAAQSIHVSQQASAGVDFADGYHGKVVPLEAARKLVMVKENIDLPDLEKIIPYHRARDIVMHNPDHIAVIDCPCRSSREHPCLPLDVCLVVGEPFASFVIEHHPQRSRRISRDEAVEILQAENQRGHVQHAFFKDAMLGRFYAICNCCSCCCGAMQAYRNGTPMLAPSGYVVWVDEKFCIGCSDCTQYCQFGAITLEGSKASVDVQGCMGCGVCVNVCTNNALSLRLDPSKGEPLEIFKLMARAAK